VSGVALSPDGATLAVGDQSYRITLWDTRTGALLHTLSAHIDEIYAIRFSPDGRLLASSGHDKVVYLWDVASGKPVHKLWGHKNWAGPVAFSPDGTRLLTGDYSFLRLWDVPTGNCLRTVPVPLTHWMAFSQDGRTLVSGGSYTRVDLRDTEDWHIRTSLREPSIGAIAVGASDTLLTGGGSELKLWDLRTGKPRQVLASASQEQIPVWIAKLFPFLRPKPIIDISSVAISPDAAQVAVGTTDGSVMLWPVR
jgi:WD40 repeat protein